MRDKAMLLVHETARMAWGGKSIFSLRREMHNFHVVPILEHNGQPTFHLIYAVDWNEIDTVLKTDFNGMLPNKDAYLRIGPIRSIAWYGLAMLRREFDLSRFKSIFA